MIDTTKAEQLEIECDCDNWTICQNHLAMAKTFNIDPLLLIQIINEIQEGAYSCLK